MTDGHPKRVAVKDKFYGSVRFPLHAHFVGQPLVIDDQF